MKNLFKIARKKFINESSWNIWRWSDFEEGDKVSIKRDGPNGDTWVHATVIDSDSRAVTVKWDEKRPLLCPTETLRIPRIFLFKNYIRKQNPYDESSEKNVPIWTITMLEIVNRGNDEESSEDATPMEYSKTYYNADDAWDDAEKLVDEYKDEEGYFQVDVWEGEYETPNGDILGSDEMYDIFHMLTGTEGYQGHILFEESPEDLVPTNGRKSFGGKAKVVSKNGWKLLYSYNTLVAGIDDDGYGGVHRFTNFQSSTTRNHIQSFLDTYHNIRYPEMTWRDFYDKVELENPDNELVFESVFVNEGTSNFKPMKEGFPLIVYNDQYCKVCPKCNYGQDKNNDKCEDCGADLSDVEPIVDDCAIDDIMYELNRYVKNANDAQDFYEVSLEPGYYEGIQFYVTPKYDDVTSWSDEDAQIQFGVDTMEEVLELKQMSREIVLKVLKQAKKELGMIELKVSARFSNGETMYDKVDEHSSVTCDGCGREVHDDTVEVVGDKVLCDRCRKN